MSNGSVSSVYLHTLPDVSGEQLAWRHSLAESGARLIRGEVEEVTGLTVLRHNRRSIQFP